MRLSAFKKCFVGGALILSLVLFCSPGHAAPTHFAHPGLLHTEADFERMRAKVTGGEHPWIDGWKILTDNPRSQLNWKPRPTANVIRGAVPGQNVGQFYPDVHAAYQLALRWKVSGDEAYAKKSIEIMNAWSGVLKSVGGNSDRFLAAGIYGYEFANAGEIMRTYPGWAKEDSERFQNMMLTVFYPMNHDFLTRHNGAAITNYWANWDLCNMASTISIGVLCDRRDIYDEAVDYFYHGRGNGAMDKAVYYVHPGNLGQWQESGRDQGHNTLGISLMGAICETAWNQGDDLYGYDNNRFLAGAEYVAKYNLGNEVPYQSYSWGTGQRGLKQTQPGVSPAARGMIRPGWEMVINHYVNIKGLSAPYSEQSAAKIRPEGGAGGHASTFDQLGFGTLTFTREPQVVSPRPSSLVARQNGDKVVLSWWGSQGAQSYSVKRATKAGGPYQTIASQITDAFTYSDEKLAPGHYFYVVTGTGKFGKETGASNEAEFSPSAVLLAHLAFDEAQGKMAGDGTGHHNDGILQNGANFAPGHQGNALSLNGTSDYLALPEGVASHLADFSVSACVYLNSEQTWARLFDFGDDRGRYLFLVPRASNGKVRFATSTVYGYNEQVVDSTIALPTRQWVHVAFTLAGRVGTLYINGNAVGSNAEMDFPPFQVGHTPHNWIGRSQFPNDPYLNGKVDDFRLYNGALSAEQVAALAGGKNVR
ncbi:hypothetical protein IAD21_01913 [Abditibacteriota bacterium]|nr:hypothetical protein IAD21_01913 [Abditibacteriota bacterium]